MKKGNIYNMQIIEIILASILVCLCSTYIILEAIDRHNFKKNNRVFKNVITSIIDNVPDLCDIEIIDFDFDNMNSRRFDAKTGEMIYLFRLYKDHGAEILRSLITVNAEGQIIKTTEWVPIEEE